MERWWKSPSCGNNLFKMATVEKKDACNDMQPISSLYQFAVQKAESRFYIKSVKELIKSQCICWTFTYFRALVM